MRITTTPIAIVILLTTGVGAYGQEVTINWQRAVGTTFSDVNRGIVRAQDGNLLAYGSREGMPSIVKLNHLTGATIWEWVYPAQDSIGRINSLVLTPDGGCAGLGYVTDADWGPQDMALFKLSVNGDLQWHRLYGGSYADEGSDVISVSGGLVLVGFTSSEFTTTETADTWVIRVNDFGQMLWEEAYPSSGFEASQEIIQCADGGFILKAYTSESGATPSDLPNYHGGQDLWVAKISGTGQMIWNSCFGGSGNDQGYDMYYENNSIVLAGMTTSEDGDVGEGLGGSDGWILLMSEGGTIDQSLRFGDEADEAFESISFEGGRLLFAGGKASTPTDCDYWIGELGPDGILLWDYTLGGGAYDYAESILLEADGSFVVAGNTTSDDGDVTTHIGGSDWWVLNLDAVVGIEEPRSSALLLTPNPSSGNYWIRCLECDGATYKMMDVTGRCLREGRLLGSGTIVDTEGLPDGKYQLVVTTKKGMLYQAVVLCGRN